MFVGGAGGSYIEALSMEDYPHFCQTWRMVQLKVMKSTMKNLMVTVLVLPCINTNVLTCRSARVFLATKVPREMSKTGTTVKNFNHITKAVNTKVGYTT